MNVLRRFFNLDPCERRTAVSAALRLVAIRLLLSTIGVIGTRRLLERQSFTHIDRVSAREAERGVLRVARHLSFLRANCLDGALTLWWLLSARGIGATLRIGVRKNDDATLLAHAWVEHDSMALLDEKATGFEPFDGPILSS